MFGAEVQLFSTSKIYQYIPLLCASCEISVRAVADAAIPSYADADGDFAFLLQLKIKLDCLD